jgi:hypothetical protein
MDSEKESGTPHSTMPIAIKKKFADLLHLRAVQLLLGHRKTESIVRYLGSEVDDALAIAEQVDV